MPKKSLQCLIKCLLFYLKHIRCMLKRHGDPFKLFCFFIFLNSFSLKDARFGIWGLFFFFQGFSCWYLYMGLLLAQASAFPFAEEGNQKLIIPAREASVRYTLFPCMGSRLPPQALSSSNPLCPSQERKGRRVGCTSGVLISALSFSLCQEAHMFSRRECGARV